jgi:aspartokinase-like uncharacterized kinase
VKLGGSLLADPALPSLLRLLQDLAKTRGLVVVPGGGPFADAVRQACAIRDPGESAAHWMAILAMDQHAHHMAGLLPGAHLTTDPPGIARAVTRGDLAVLAPFAWLRRADPLPHGWHVTSDSIAAWVAARLDAGRLILLKSVEGATDDRGEILPDVVLRSPSLGGIVDDYFATAMSPSLECWVLSGRHPDRLAELLRDGRTRGTRVR